MTKCKYIFFAISMLMIINMLPIAESRKLPVVAIMANPQPDNAVDIKRSRVNSQYVHWLEQSLADIVVIQPWYEEAQIDEILSKVNGVLFQGGDRNLTINGQFEKLSRMIVEKVMKKFDNEGVSLPIWGTCQGFELLHALFANDTNVLTHFEASGIETPIKLNRETLESSKMFSDFSKEDIFNLENKNTTAEFHSFGVSEEQYQTYSKLRDIFSITSYGQDIHGNTYIASIEGKKYPFYALQFHPEMVSYTKTKTKGVPQLMEAVRISQLLSNFFIKETLNNKNSMNAEDMEKFHYINSFTQLPKREDNGKYYYYFFNKENEPTSFFKINQIN